MAEKPNSEEKSEFQRFDETVRKMISVPRDEMQKREKEWKAKRKRAKKKRATS
jgi:hypothetical protein